MKLFISWSGENSHKIASALHDWLPYMIQTIKPFMSSGGIFKGERWSDVLTKELEDTQFGIICLTPSNIKAPWLNFEAGALSKSGHVIFVSVPVSDRPERIRWSISTVPKYYFCEGRRFQLAYKH